MNIEDLGFAYTMNIEFDGDFDGGTYYMSIKYPISSYSHELSYAETNFTLKQIDIDAMHSGALQLVSCLEKHITKGC